MERRTRIAFLSEHASPMALLGGQDAGGQNVYVDEVSRNLARLGYAVDVFTRRDSPDMPTVVDWATGVRIIHLDAGPPQTVLKDDIWAFMPHFYDELLEFMVREGVRYDIVHGNFWMSGWVAARLRRRLGIPAVQIFHATGKTKRRHQGDQDTSPSGRIAVELDVVQQVDRLIAQCPSEQFELVDDYGASPAKVALIPSAVNTERFRPVPRAEARRRIGIADTGPVVAYVGRMLPRKDVRNLVHAMGLLIQGQQGLARTAGAPLDAAGAAAPVRLLLVGGETDTPDPATTPEIGVLQQMVAELGIADRVIFTGRRGPDQLRDYYSAADVVVTTPWYEPFGLTPLEAQACGVPVVGSAVGGITYTVQEGVTGHLVPPRDPQALAERLGELLSQPERRAQMGRAARERVEREFTWPVVAHRTAQLYQSLLARKVRSTKYEVGKIQREG
jgi:glycosyltransferase involved in cell wall biosynthesis